jgi:signal transduction histidine kinase
MERFAYTVSHDLKSPLVTITGFLGLLKGHVSAGRTEKAVAAADRALGAAERMGRLIEDLLVLSRAGRPAGKPEPVDLDALAGRLAGELRGRAGQAGGVLVVREPLGGVVADKTRLAEALENLLANAVRYGLGGGGTRVEVRTEPTARGALRLVVEDDGPGVPEPYRDRVFELFQRLDTGGDGTGVGLAVVARVMEVLGGRASVESAGGPEGREGARFVLTFPPQAVARDRSSATAPSLEHTLHTS